MSRIRACFVPVWLIALSAPWAVAAEPGASSKEVAAIRAAADAYVSALEQGNRDALAAAWTPEGDYIDAAGRSFKARELIAAEFGKGGSARRHGLKVTIDGIRLVTADVAVEDGHLQHAVVSGEPPQRSRYTAVWVKRNSRWLLDSLREA